MAIKEYADKQIDQYINGKMSDPEKENFRKTLECNSNLRSRFLLRQMVIESIQKETEKVEEKALLKARSRQLTRRIILAVTLLFLFLFFVGNSYEYKSQDLFTEYFFIPYFEYSSDSNKPSADEALVNNELISFYNQKAYSEAVALYKEKWETDSITHSVPTLLVVSVCALHADETPLAISILEQIQQPDYQEKADWLLLCCYLQEDKRGEAIGIANQITLKGNRLSEKAFEIKSKLEQKKWF